MTDDPKRAPAGSGSGGEDGATPDGSPSLTDVAAELGVELTPEGETPPSNPFAEPPPTAVREAYQQAPAGPATRMFMDSAGIFSRQRQHRLSAALAGVLGAVVATAIGLDIAGVIEIPGMGLMYDVTGVDDPNRGRAIARTKEQLRAPELTPEERQALRDKLLGLKKPEPVAAPAARPAPPVVEKGIVEQQTLTHEERDLAVDVFSDSRKSEQKLELAPPSEIQAPNLPQGLTAEAISEVIQKNHRSMSLCIAKGMKAGESIEGRMEVEITIAVDGSVSRAQIETPELNGTALGNCTVKTVKRWRFPRFDGEAVTVQFPYVLSAGF